MTPDLRSYDWFTVNTSAGKDSQSTLRETYRRCIDLGVDPRRIIAVHCDLGRVEWPGTRQLAGRQVEHYPGVKFEIVRRAGCDLLDRVRERGKWPGMRTTRWCTSDFKRTPVRKLMTSLSDIFHGGPHNGPHRKFGGRPCRILNIMGMRAQESPDRGKMLPFAHDHHNGRRSVDTWLPIHPWPVEEVWSDIRKSGVPHHHVYDLGMPRLSCTFCIYANEKALILAGKLRPELLDQYCQAEQETGHKFKQNLSLINIQTAIRNGVDPGPVDDWKM